MDSGTDELKVGPARRELRVTLCVEAEVCEGRQVVWQKELGCPDNLDTPISGPLARLEKLLSRLLQSYQLRTVYGVL